MAKLFATGEAKQLLRDYIKLRQSVANINSVETRLKTAALDAVDALVGRECAKVVNDIPVDELNRDKQGIRIKLLYDNGYQNVGDVLKASVSRLEAINGIGKDSAKTIRSAALKIAKGAEKGIKLRLSADDKSKEMTDLVFALYKYQKGADAFKRCAELERETKADGEKANLDLKAATGTFKWIFASQDKKAKAEGAYQYLNWLINGEFYKSITADEKQLRMLSIVKSNEAANEFAKNPIPFVTLLEELAPQYVGGGDDVYGLPEDVAQGVAQQQLDLSGLRCSLRKYQEWGVKYILNKKRVLLGDEMGLGKTVQAIAAMVALRNGGATHFLVICPASVLSNWNREIEKHSDLNVIKIHGDNRMQAFESWVKQGGAGVTTYETTAFFANDKACKADMLVVDEAHYIKNPQAQRTINVKAIAARAKNILFMTGTALENRVEEMITLMAMLQPKVAAEAGRIASLSSAPMFREKVAPVYYRRRREDVLTELPELIENIEWCSLNKVERAAYKQAITEGNFPAARRVSWNVDDMEQSSKAQRMLEIIEDAKEDGRKVIVFSFFLDTIAKVSALMGNRCMQPITGAVSPERRQEILDEFEKAPAGSVLAAQIISGGTGLNIQTASVVILCEPQFKPSIENQAISRAYRMGQSRNVLCYRLLCEDTVDERIMAILAEKQRQFDAFADESAAANETIELDGQTFANIMESERQRIAAEEQGF